MDEEQISENSSREFPKNNSKTCKKEKKKCVELYHMQTAKNK